MPASITLIGRCSSWGMRFSAPAQHSVRKRISDSRDTHRLTIAWLHQRSYGTLGVYLADPPSDLRKLPAARQWIQVRGVLQPRYVYSQADDPRSAQMPNITPLALAMSEWCVINPAVDDNTTQVEQQYARLLPGQRHKHGLLAPIYQQPDWYHWQQSGRIPPRIAPWNRIAGIVTTIGGQRYLRYVVSRV